MKTIESPGVLVLGASGLTGSAIASILDNGAADIEVVRAARNKEKVEAWKREGKQAVYLDLDDARTFSAALEGIDRLFLLTGYTIAMLHQSKTLVDAAADSGVIFIVHQCIFGSSGRRMGALASAYLHAEYPYHLRAPERPIALAHGG